MSYLSHPKICTKCNQIKDLDKFSPDSRRKSGYQSRCKLCRNESNRNNKQKRNEYLEEYRNRPQVRKELVIYQAEYRKNIPLEKKREYRKRYCEKNPMVRIRSALRRRLRNAIKGNYKAGSAVRDLGCSMEFFKEYFESKFQQGMNWSNHGEWHIDHIIPLSLFDLSDRNQFLKACHYTNLQPLWALDNIRKSDYC